MNLLSWNCQGLGVPLTVKFLKEEVYRNKPQLVFLMETKQKRTYVKKIKKKCNFLHEWIVDPVGLSGGLALFWSDDIIVNISSSSANIIHTSIAGSKFDTPRYITFVYGPTDENYRNACWEEITCLARHMNQSWMCIGDFNDIASITEKSGGKPRPIRKIINFQNFIDLL